MEMDDSDNPNRNGELHRLVENPIRDRAIDRLLSEHRSISPGISSVYSNSSIFTRALSTSSGSHDTSLDLHSNIGTPDPDRSTLKPSPLKTVSVAVKGDQPRKTLSAAQKIGSYELPCEFGYLGCDRSFQPAEFELWIYHTTSHFGGVGPPPRASCTICDDSDTTFNWRERMFHIGNHLQTGTRKADKRPDPLVYEYLLLNGIIAPHFANKPGAEHQDNSAEFSSKDQLPDQHSGQFDPNKERDQVVLPQPLQDHHVAAEENIPSLPLDTGNDINRLDGTESNEHIPTSNDQYSAPELLATSSGTMVQGLGIENQFQGLRTNDETAFQELLQRGKKGKHFGDTSSQDSDYNQEDEEPRHRLQKLDTSTEYEQHSLDEHSSPFSTQSPNFVSTSTSFKLTGAVNTEAREDAQSIDTSTSGMNEADVEISPRGRSKTSQHTVGRHTSSARELASTSSTRSISICNTPDDTDFEEDTDDEILGQSELLESDNQMLADSLSPEMMEIVDQMIEDYSQVSVLGHGSIVAQQAGSSTPTANPTNSSQPAPASKTTNLNLTTKRRLNTEDDEINEGDRQGAKPPGNSTGSPGNMDNNLRFACPYRKHNPRKYSVQDWKHCALTHHKTVARVKAHLYRYHLIHQCQRCKLIFKSEEELDTHIEAPEACQLAVVSEHVEGITSKLKQQIQSRKRAHPSQTEADKWQQIYRMIFPGETAPDPYFDPVVDRTDGSTQSSDIGGIYSQEEFLRREISRLFRSALESVKTSQSQESEESFRSQLVNIMEEAQRQAFESCRRQMASEKSSAETSSSVSISPEAVVDPVPQRRASSQTNEIQRPAPSTRVEIIAPVPCRAPQPRFPMRGPAYNQRTSSTATLTWSLLSRATSSGSTVENNEGSQARNSVSLQNDHRILAGTSNSPSPPAISQSPRQIESPTNSLPDTEIGLRTSQVVDTSRNKGKRIMES